MTAALILAGGRGTRIGGRNKAFLTLGGRQLIVHVRARLAPQAGPLAISANGDLARFASLRLPVLADPVPGGLGPLAGILAGLTWAADRGERWLLTAAVDTPFLPLDLARRLAEAQAAAQAPLALAARAAGDGVARLHPTFGLWSVDLRDDLGAALAGGGIAVRAFADRHGAATAVFPPGPHDPFFNINTPGDLATAALHTVDV